MSEAILETDRALTTRRGLSEVTATHAHRVLRIALASVFIYHGVGKL